MEESHKTKSSQRMFEGTCPTTCLAIEQLFVPWPGKTPKPQSNVDKLQKGEGAE